ncbi:acetamidase/formamidase family protein [Candidimonas humi]|uniref:Acetamidase/formamidase family protein n=1 Tax=Candidimonas humi TaxID=683355 RepID=A0ABV8NZP5_9BURK|nr:acetamidase/formamidase family protein [Candidimonas humi]MBV6306818.1 acetamidase/formamidase family protein [Candidimonas humi]
MSIHHLSASKNTVRVGLIDRSYPPLLSIESGDELHLSTWSLWAGEVEYGASFDDIMQVRQRYAGRGPHTLTGPVAVRGAKAGQVLRVDILQLEVGATGFNIMTPGQLSRGLLAPDFPQGTVRHFKIDRATMTADFCGGIRIPVRPFLGILGVAPEAAGGHTSSVPGPFGGNIDCAELVAGTTLYLPIWVDEALFYAGDAHAVQGHGEVNGTALETSMDLVRLRLSVEPGMKLGAPRAETPTHWITMDFDPDLRTAARRALEAMVALIKTLTGLALDEAYRLCSLAADLIITQVVNGHQGVHVRLPKSLFASHKDQV